MIKITDKQKQKIATHKEWFNERTTAGHVVNYLNGFVGVGVFSKPQDHISKGVNDIWIYGIGFSKNGKRIVENTNVEVTLDEAEDLARCLKIAIKRKKEENHKNILKKKRIINSKNHTT